MVKITNIYLICKGEDMKRSIDLVFALLLAILLCACGESSHASVPEPAPAPETTPAPDHSEELAELEERLAGLEEENAGLREELEQAEEEFRLALDEATFTPDHGLRPDGSFDSGTVFIGDSLTYGLVTNYLIPEGLIGDARYMAIGGMPLKQFFGGSLINGSEKAIKRGNVYSPEFEGLSFAESVAAAGESVESVYLMLGTNLGSDSTWYKYVEVIDHILLACPNATVFLQTVPYSSSELINYRTPNESIHAACEHYAAAGTERVRLLDTHTALGSAYLTVDGIHLTCAGQKCWYEFLKSSAEN